MSQRGSCPKGAHLHTPTRWWIQAHSTIALIVALILGTTITLIAQNSPTPTQTPKTVTLRADGDERQVSTTKNTVQTLLHQEHIVLGKHDQCDPSMKTALVNGMVITVSRVTYEEIRERVTIPAPEVVRVSSRVGATPIVYPGRPGVAIRTRCVWKKDGVVSVEWTNSTRTVVRPLPTVIIRGGAPSRSGMADRGKTFMVEATAYTPYDAGCNGITATGARAT
ncbi:MAG: ubiquitin-like domain-containing protein, partial [Armatimonadota bacterium]